MKRFAALAMILGMMIVPAKALAQGVTLPPPGPLEHISGNLYKIFGGGGNTLVFVTEDGVVLVDTKLPNNGQSILDEVRKVSDKPVSTIIVSHNHPDHLGSNDFFRELYPDLQVIAHENTKKWVEANAMYKPEVRPDVTFTDRMTIGEGDDRVELYYFGVAHTDGDAFVVFPAARAMFLGDIMAWNMSPLIDPPTGGSVIALPDALELAASTLEGEIDLVIEGHGAVNTWEGYLTFTRFNRALLNAARSALEAGGYNEESVAAAVEELGKTPEFAPLLGEELLAGLEYGNTPKARAGMNVRVAFQQLTGERVTTNFGGTLPAPGEAPAGPAFPPPAAAEDHSHQH